jgi:beta-glucosidase
MDDDQHFPDAFLFGASISAYQTEGNNTNTDWWWRRARAGRAPS